MLRTKVAGLTVFAVLVVFAAASFADEKKSEGEWTQLFNGKDLTGWKIPEPPSGSFKSVEAKKNDAGKVVAYVGTLKNGKEETLWQVKDGLLIGAGTASHLFSEGEYDNFRYKVEAKINDKGNSGQYFRTKFGPGFPAGYESQINATHGDPIRTGSLYPAGGLGKYKKDIAVVMGTATHKADEFFTQEVIADGATITIIVNGKVTLDKWTDPDKTYTKGHFALQGHDPGTVVTFKSIAVAPLK